MSEEKTQVQNERKDLDIIQNITIKSPIIP